MTSYWDDWSTLLYKAQHGQVNPQIFTMALTQLIEGLHEFDHTHGGHVLDVFLERNKHLSELMKNCIEAKA
jgi:hypothetical protein